MCSNAWCREDCLEDQRSWQQMANNTLGWLHRSLNEHKDQDASAVLSVSLRTSAVDA